MIYKKVRSGAVSPEYKTSGSAGFDLACAEKFNIRPGETVAVPTGLAFEVPQGFELQIRPRSGISLKTNLLVVLGTVDSDYRGEVAIICKNIGKEILGFDEGSRLAQGVLSPVVQSNLTEVVGKDLSDTERGCGGFGSTGV